MDKYKRYYGLAIFALAVAILIALAVFIVEPKVQKIISLRNTIEAKEQELITAKGKLDIVTKKIKRIKDSIMTSQKKVYSPIEADLGNETLFFTLYNDIIEIIHSNSVKIKSIDYNYNPETDEFVKFGKDVYFVCDVNMELVSNYVQLGKLIQDIYQYPYYIKINNIEIKPYQKDKRILITEMSLRLYAHTAPEENLPVAEQTAE